MATSEDRLRGLNIAGYMVHFEHSLRSSGKNTIWWGVFSLVVGAGIATVNQWAGAISLVLGALLVGEGIYEMRTRQPKAMMVSAITLGVLAAWHFTLAGLSYYLLGRMRGNAIIAGAIQAWGAFNTWKAYRVYAALRELADPAMVEETRRWVSELATQDSSSIRFRVKPLTEEEQFWRVKFMDDLALLVRLGGTFGRASSNRLNIREVVWLRAPEIRVERQSEAWMGKEVKATIHIGETKIEKALISPEMLQRLDMRA